MTAGNHSPVLAKPHSASTPGKRKVFLADDHPIFRHGLAGLINSEDDLEVTGMAGSASETLGALREQSPDVVVVDICLQNSDGIELTRQIHAEHRRLPILILSMHDESAFALKALRAGASGYLMKSDSENSLLLALRQIMDGKIYVSAAFGDRLIYRVLRNESAGQESPLEVLTQREMEILRLIGSGKSSNAIAQELALSVKTVESHRLHIKEKLGLATAADLVRFARDWVEQLAPAG